MTSLANSFPAIADEWHPTKNGNETPQGITPGSDFVAIWISPNCGHAWKMPVNRRCKRPEMSCQVCNNRQLLVGVNDLESRFPTIAAQWHPTKNGDLKPSQVLYGERAYRYWQCPKGHEWESRVYSRTNIRNARIQGECPKCAGRMVEPGETDLATVNPKLAAEWHPTKNGDLQPSQFLPGTKKRVWWLCSQGHEWEVEIKYRHKDRGCIECARTYVEDGKSLEDMYPDIAAEWHPTKNESLTPAKTPYSSARTIWWVCERSHEWYAKVYSRTRNRGGSGCPECNASTFVSKSEKELANVIYSLIGEHLVRTSARSVIKKSELDIYIPSKNIAIEFNGLYWHSEATGKDRNYHANKSKACAEKGIQLIHVWEDDWRDRQDIVVRAIAHRLSATERLNEPEVLLVPDESLAQRYGARTLTPEAITYAESSVFLEANHIQGPSNGTLHVGLRDKDGILRAVFVTKRVGNKNHEGEWRIERYATRGIVPGGFTKLIKFTQSHIDDSNLGKLTTWVTFSDRALSDGGLYKNYGFVEDGFTKPDYQYIVSAQRVHKFKYRLKRFRDDTNLQYDENLSERELALLNKIYRIWDSGKTRWIYKVDRMPIAMVHC